MSRTLIPIDAVCKKCGGVSKATLYRQVAGGRFPKPLKLFEGGAASRWIEEEVDAALEARKAARAAEPTQTA